MPELVRAIADAYGEARAAWPDVEVEATWFEAELRRRLGDELTPAALRRVAVADVYLAVACLAGDAAAVGHVERACAAEVGFAAHRLRAPDAVADDVRGQLYRVLFTAEPGRAAALADFTGRANLKGYLRVIASRELVRAINRGRREVPIEPLVDRLDLEHSAELAVFRAQHGSQVSAALRAALDALDDRQRALLRYSLVDGWSIDQLGALYGVHRSTASRWVTAVRDALAGQLRDQLAARLAIHTDEVESIVRLVRSQIDVSLERIL
jgi:RNA polymerase sigma-70 factor (ECF subfamily)